MRGTLVALHIHSFTTAETPPLIIGDSDQRGPRSLRKTRASHFTMLLQVILFYPRYDSIAHLLRIAGLVTIAAAGVPCTKRGTLMFI